MNTRQVRTAGALVVALLAGAPAAGAPLPSAGPSAAPSSEKLTRPIAIAINGEPLETDTPPQVVGGRLLVPLRPVMGALGVPVTRSGNEIVMRIPTGSFTLTVGSSRAVINGNDVTLDATVSDIDGTTYVPLRVLSAALGATATYDQRGAKVEIVSAYIGRAAGPEQSRAGGGTNVQGVVSAVDTDSAPPTVTVVQAGVSRTINITSDAKIFVEDATIHSQAKASLDQVHVGDALLAVLTRDGRVAEVHDYFRSLSGTISAVSPIAFVLENGRVVQPGKSTDITLDGTAAQLADLHVGDFVTVRSNPETGELRQVIATRSAARPATAATTAVPTGTPSPQSSSAASIASVQLSATRPLRAGETLDVTMQGTPGGRATFDIGDYLTGIAMRESSPGTYVGHFTIPDRFNVTQVPVYANLNAGGAAAPRVRASSDLSAATTPPTIGDVAPPPNQTVNNSRPSIFATFVAPTDIAINPSSVSLVVNGHDVTASSTRTGSFVTYSPSVDYPDGQVTVVVRVSDAAGNSATKTWSFTVRTHER